MPVHGVWSLPPMGGGAFSGSVRVACFCNLVDSADQTPDIIYFMSGEPGIYYKDVRPDIRADGSISQSGLLSVIRRFHAGFLGASGLPRSGVRDKAAFDYRRPNVCLPKIQNHPA